MKKLAIITARGGSKRIPHKNIKDFLGKPIIEYSIKTALNTGIYDEVMVSTDDEKIAEIAVNAGANVPFYRSEKTANDFAATADVILEVIEEYEKLGEKFDIITCIYPTAPLISIDRLIESMDLLMSNKYETVMPVVQFSFPPQRSLIVKDNKLVAKHPEFMPMRSQDLEPFYHDCGQFYTFLTKEFIKQKTIIMKNTFPIILSELEVQDIDNMEDWKIAELKYKILRESERGLL